MSYRLLRALVRMVVGVFYRRIDVVGLDQVPASGPLIVAANHQNGLVDPMLLIATLPRPLVPLAKATLFRHPFIAPFLHWVDAIPVERRQDPGSDPRRNEAMFAAAFAALERNQAILIFPEGVSQPEPALMPLRTGVARILLGSDARARRRFDTTLLPVGLILDEPGAFRTGRALVSVGEPVPTADCVALYASDPDAAVRQLTDRLAGALRRHVLEADNRETLRLIRLLEAAWREESADPGADAAARAAWARRATRAYRYLREYVPGEVERFRAEVERYEKDLELAGVTVHQLSRSYAPATVWRYTLRETGSLLLGLPLALAGTLMHVLPYQATAVVARILRPAPDTQATYKIFAAVALYPLAWILEGWLVWRLTGAWGLGLFLIALVPTAFLALTWRERLARFTREARGFAGFVIDRDLHRRLGARRRQLVASLERLAQRVPSNVLAEPRDAPHVN